MTQIHRLKKKKEEEKRNGPLCLSPSENGPEYISYIYSYRKLLVKLLEISQSTNFPYVQFLLSTMIEVNWKPLQEATRVVLLAPWKDTKESEGQRDYPLPKATLVVSSQSKIQTQVCCQIKGCEE